LSEPQPRIVVAITGATGSIIGVRLLEVMRDAGVETHLIMSKWGARTMIHETSRTMEEVNATASYSYNPGDQGAAISSGSFLTDGMVIAPCSMRTLAAIASGQGEHLVHRAADVILKERRKLVLVVRESPLSEIHLENMLKLARMGVTILPPMPGFYNHPKSVAEIVDHIVMRILDQFGIHTDLTSRWDGEMRASHEGA
jgi:4-hydroxy-3-polyprenylbenzoate decarboxylase